MRKDISILVIGTMLSVSDVLPTERKDEAYLIRRAYIDVLGIVPTVVELDWYCVYNDDGYSKAVEWLLTRREVKNKDELKAQLLSSQYKTEQKKPISAKQLEDILYYIAGVNRDTLTLNEVKLKIILFAQEDSNSDLEAIDCLALQLMGRTTSVQEANSLLRILRQQPKESTTEEIWLHVLDHLLSFEDVTHK